jgi:magnesium transporter
VSFFVGEGFILSMQEYPGDPYGPVRERLKAGDRRLREGGTDHLAYALLDAIVDHYFPLLGDIGERIEDLEQAVVESPRDENLVEIQRLRRLLILFRRHAWPMRDAVQGLARGDLPFVKPETRVYLRDTLDHLFRIVEILESYRDILAGLMDLHLSAINIRMNQVVQVLTVISTIFIPLTFIAGVYGMNFDPDAGVLNMPELRTPWGYPAVLVVMGVIGFGLLFFFWRRGWIGRGPRRRSDAGP